MANRIKGITVEIGGDTTGLDKALKNVNSNIKNTQSQLKDVNRLLKLDPTNTTLLAQKQKLLKDAISETKNKLDTLKEAQKQAKQQFEAGNLGKDKYDALQREIVETENELKKLQKEAEKSSTVMTKLSDTGDKFQKVGGKITDVGKKVSIASGVVGGLGIAAVKTAADFDSAMSKVSAISGTTGDDFNKLREKAREMGSKTKFSATEAAEAMQYMAMAGWKTGDMLEGVEGIMNLAAASGEDLATTSDIVTDALTAFGLEAKDSGHFADILAAASSNANTNVYMMGETFSYCAPIAGALGFTAEDTAEAIGLMANAGIKSSQAGTALRTVMNNLSGDVKITGKALGEVTVKTTNADGTMRSLHDILGDCRSAFNKLTDSEKAQAAETLVGKNAMSGFLALMNAGEGDVNKLNNAIKNCTYKVDGIAESLKTSGIDWTRWSQKGLDSGQVITGMIDDVIYQTDTLGLSSDETLSYLMTEYDLTAQEATTAFNLICDGMNNSTGVAQEMATVMQDNLGGQITILKSQLQELAISFGEILMPMVMKVVDKIKGFVDRLNNLDEGTKNMIVKVGLFVTALGPLLMTIGKVTEGIGGVMKLGSGLIGIFTKVAAAFTGTAAAGTASAAGTAAAGTAAGGASIGFGALSAALLPIIGIIAAITAAIAGIILIIKNWGKIVEWFKGIWEHVCNFLSRLWEGLKTVFTNIWNGIKDVFTKVTSAIADFAKRAWEGIKTTLSNIWNGIKSVAKTVWNGIKDTCVNIWNGMKSAAKTIFEGMKNTITTIWQNIKSAAKTIWGGIKDTCTSLWQKMKDGAKNIFGKIKDGISGAWNWVKEKTSGVWNSIKEKTAESLQKTYGTVNEKTGNMKQTTGNAFEQMRECVRQKVDQMNQQTGNKFKQMGDNMKNTLNNTKTNSNNIFENIRNGMVNAMTNAKTGVGNVLERMKGFFNFQWRLPHIKLPHFNVSGSPNPLDWFTQGLPRISVDWYKKAMNGGMILNSPTIFGMQDGKLLAGGEAGSEAVVGTGSLMHMIQKAVNNAMTATENIVNYGGFTINVYGQEGQDVNQLAAILEKKINDNIRRKELVFG